MDTKIPNHQVTAHSPSTLKKIKKVGIGQKLADIEKTFGSTYRRLDPNKPSPTVTRSGYRDFIHPYEDRMLTVRELACLQTFPLDWEIKGVRLDSYSSKRKTTMTQFGQVGNAVPPKLSEAVAAAIMKQWFCGEETEGKTMAKVPYEVTKESYLLKSTFFYNKLKVSGYFKLFLNIEKMSKIEGPTLNWSQRDHWKISASAWDVLEKNHIDPMLVFAHPKVIQLYPSFLKYYRSVAMISQKGLKALTGVSYIEKIEEGKVEAGRLPQKSITSIVSIINEILSLVVSLATDIDKNEIQGMMYATAGTNIDGSWRNSIGAEGERVIRSIILKELLAHDEVTSVTDRQNKTTAIGELQKGEIVEEIGTIKTVNLVNGYSLLFSSEPDISMFNDEGAVVGVIEIKAGLDPAGALERLGAMFKSFENTLAEYPDAVTILVASCITDEVEARLGASMSVRQKYITTEITSSENNQRKFANRMRKILKLI